MCVGVCAYAFNRRLRSKLGRPHIALATPQAPSTDVACSTACAYSFLGLEWELKWYCYVHRCCCVTFNITSDVQLHSNHACIHCMRICYNMATYSSTGMPTEALCVVALDL